MTQTTRDIVIDDAQQRRCISLFESSVAARINLTWRGSRVDGGRFRDIAHELRQVRLGVVSRVQGPLTPIPPPLNAYYWPALDVIQLVPNANLSTLATRAVVIHEGVHAIHDLEGLSLSTLETEGMAFVALVLFRAFDQSTSSAKDFLTRWLRGLRRVQRPNPSTLLFRDIIAFVIDREMHTTGPHAFTRDDFDRRLAPPLKRFGYDLAQRFSGDGLTGERLRRESARQARAGLEQVYALAG